MKPKILIIIAAVIFTGCVTKSGPANNTDFQSDPSLSDLQGKYRNKGDAGDIDYDIYLSRIIWPDDNEIEHEKIDFVEVKEIDKNTLTVTAITDGKAVKNGKYLLGKDFSFENGLITIRREKGIAGFKSGEPMLGLYYDNATLGLDKKGHGKFRSSGAAVGMVYMVVPIALKAQEDVRFERVE